MLGPFWITISQGVLALGLGLLYSTLFKLHLPTFLPFIVTGFIIWSFISGCLTEGMSTFITNEGLIKHLPEHAREAVMFRNGLATYHLPETVPALEGQTRVF